MLLCLGMLVALMRSARVQTAALSVLSEQLTRGLGARVDVGMVSYKFPNRLLIEHVLVEDRQQDTLLYVDTLSARADMLKLLREDTLCVKQVSLIGAYFNAYVGTDSNMNYRFLADAFASDKEKNSDFHINLQVHDIRLRRLRTRVLDWRGSLPAADLHVHNITPKLFDVEIERLTGMAYHYNTPFDLRSVEAHLIINDTVVTLPKLHAVLPMSDLHVEQFVINRADAKRLYESLPRDSITRTKMLAKVAVNMRVDEAVFTPADFRAFSPALASMRQPWILSADVQGRVDSLEAHGLRLQYRYQDLLRGDIVAYGLPAADSLYIEAQCQDFSVNKAVLQDILSGVRGKPVILPSLVGRLGNIHYKGALAGRVDNLILKGAFTTALGSVRTDGHAVLLFPEADSLRKETNIDDVTGIRFNGSVSTKRFHLGKALGVAELGTVGLTVNANGEVGENKPFEGKAKATINHATFRGYTYRDITVDGLFKDKIFKGELNSDDENINFSFNGEIHLSEQSPNYNFTLDLRHFRPGLLNLSEKYADSDLRLRLQVELSGSDVNHIGGFATVNNLCFYHNGDSLRMREFVMKNEVGAGELPHRTLRIDSRFLTASVTGDYNLTTLGNAVMRQAAHHLPSVFPEQMREKLLAVETGNCLEFYVYGRDLDLVSDILDLPVVLYDRPTLKGYLYDDERRGLSLQAVVPDMEAGSHHIENLTLSLGGGNRAADEALLLSLFAMHHHGDTPIAENFGDINLYLSARATGDSLGVILNWLNPDTVHNAGELNLRTVFSRYADEPLITARIIPSEIILSDSLWHVGGAQVSYCAADTTIGIDNFYFGSASQHIYADGVLSTSEQDTIYAKLENVDLDYILGALTDIHKSLYFGGTVTGWAKAYGILRKPMFEAEVTMLHAHINEGEIGDVYATAGLDSLNHVIIKGDVYDSRLEGRHVVHVDGEVGMQGDWGLMIYPDSVDVSFVNYWCKEFLTDLTGRATGAVHVWGRNDPVTRKPGTWVSLTAKAHNIGLTIPYTGGRYFVNDSVFMDSLSLSFPSMTLHDTEGNELLLDGRVWHNGDWKDIHYDINVDSHHAIVLNIPTSEEQMYGGKVYADGQVSIRGDERDCNIVANATTTAGSSFVFSVASASSASDNSFIEFVDHSEEEKTLRLSRRAAKLKKQASTQPAGRVNLTLQVDVTPTTEVSVLLDKHTGDKLRGRGEGSLRINYSDPGDVRMLGTFTLLQGTFGFTFQNVIRREFQIAGGSSATWTGNPETPSLDIHATYKVTASLRDLFGSDVSSVTNRGSVPVNCVLSLSGVLTNPIIRFGIELPSSDESVASQVKGIINTDEMLMRQVLYLLVFNRFYTPEYLQNTSNVGLNETYSLISSTVTGQINSWLSRLTDIVSVGFNFRTDGQGAESSQEYEAQFEIHPVRGLLINGNFGYRYNDISNQPVFGNLDVEYMLTKDGKLRAKAYTHTVDKYSLRQANTVQGVGFVFKHDFNWPALKKKKKDKETSTK